MSTTELHILIVDDSAIFRKRIATLLSSYGKSFGEAEDGKQALQELQRAHDEGAPFDLVTLDLNMPETTDQTIAEIIASTKQFGGKTLILSAELTVKRILSLHAAGFEHYLSKSDLAKGIDLKIEKMFAR